VKIICEAIKCYEQATGAKPNIEKSSVLAVGNWDTSCDGMGIPYKEEITVLGVKLKNTVKKLTLASWTRVTAMVRTQARRAYSRDLNMAQRITYVQTCLLSKLWYTAQVLHRPRECIRQIVSAVVWYTWQGAIFRVPLSMLQRRKEDGEWNMMEVEIKCCTFFFFFFFFFFFTLGYACSSRG